MTFHRQTILQSDRDHVAAGIFVVSKLTKLNSIKAVNNHLTLDIGYSARKQRKS